MSEKTKRASAGDSIETINAGWSFGGGVAEKFDAHVSRSIPCYEEGHSIVIKLSDFFLGERSLCYDLGCSTGSLLRSLGRHHAHKEVRFMGLDREEEMIRKARADSAEFSRLSFRQVDLGEFSFEEKADMIISYYTLQFLRPKERPPLLKRIYDALEPGGAFLLFEKIRAPDARFQDMISTLYTEFKMEQGYTGAEILAKAGSLKGVLDPFSSEENRQLLREAGFTKVMTLFAFLSFEGIVAVK